MEHKALLSALKSASKPPLANWNEESEESLVELYKQQMGKLVGVVHAAQRSLDSGVINGEQFDRLLFAVDAEITRFAKRNPTYFM
ncbi:hypothetical protein FRC03_007982 [Tulasnella sp. 419]|nr:hypothetical protein FRC03_007982 [Tulasnella sp. 419]